MKRAFTLIELIFVIVIIGLLSAVAVPKFLNLKQHAEASNVVKTTVDAAQQAVEVAVNYRDLENNSSFDLKDIIKLNGKNWSWSNDNNTTEYKINSNTVAKVTLHSLSKLEYYINCNNFSDDKTKEKCVTLLNNSTDNNITDVNLTF